MPLSPRQHQVLALLDDQCFFPKATDKTYVDKLNEVLSKDEKFGKPGFREEGDFSIDHYAGKVVYQAENWLVKNKDPLNDNVTSLLENSSVPFVQSLWGDQFSGMVASANRTRKGAFRTVGHIYKEQLANLMTTLNHTAPHFVRCIIPNHKKRPGQLDSALILDQLRCNGVLEGIRICRKGFPNRIIFQEFKQRYQLLTPDAVPKGFCEGRNACTRILDALQLDANSYRVGTTKIFFRAGVLAQLEEQRDKQLSKMVVGLQAYCRGYLARRYHGALLHGSNAILVIQRNARAYMKLRSWPWWKLFTKVKPLLKVARGDEELRLLREELERWKEKAEKEEALRIAAEAARDALQDENRRLHEQEQQDSQALAEAEDIRVRLASKKAELERELEELEEQLDEQIESNQKLLGEKKTLMTQMEDLKADLGEANFNEAQINRLEAARAEDQAALAAKTQESEELEAQRVKMSKELKSVQEELDDAMVAKAKAEKARRKFQQELEDANVELDREKQNTASSVTKERAFDKKLAEERSKSEALSAQLDASQAKVRTLETNVLNLKNELADLTDSNALAEKNIKRLKTELSEVMESIDSGTRNAAEREKAASALAATVEEQKQMIIELEDELQLVEDAKLRLEVNMRALEEKTNGVDAAVLEEEERKRKTLQREMHALEEELEAERHKYGKLNSEKKKIELQLRTTTETLEDEQKLRMRDARARKKAEKKLKQLTQERESDSSIGGAAQAEIDKLREMLAASKKERNDMVRGRHSLCRGGLLHSTRGGPAVVRSLLDPGCRRRVS